jgi:hypothetical protein
LRQALGHSLAHEVQIRTLGEDRRDLAESVAGKRAGAFDTRQSRERGFNRERHPLLDFDRSERRCGRVDLHLLVGDVGQGIDG